MAEPSEATSAAESVRLDQDARRVANWKRWGPYLSERQWATVREDYSADGNVWDSFPHDHARSRAYRWGEDGLLGICDREGRLCFSVALWNGKDPILKERLFGLTGPQGNHGEDVKECYYYLDSSPTHSYMRGLYKYPQAEYPYARLVEENARRNREMPEFELADAGVFDESRYFDVFAEYAKASPDDILIKITVANRGPDVATIHLLPTLWFRNSWSWGCLHEGCEVKPWMRQTSPGVVEMRHATLGAWTWHVDGRDGTSPDILFTDNETNLQKLYGVKNTSKFAKDGINDCVVNGKMSAVDARKIGTKASAKFVFELAPGEERSVRLRLSATTDAGVDTEGQAGRGDSAGADAHKGDAGKTDVATGPLTKADAFADFDSIFDLRKTECDAFYNHRLPKDLNADQRNVMRQAYAGLLWSKQFYHYIIRDWIEGDPLQPAPPPQRKTGRNADWGHLYNRDVVSMPDKWEYPWYAAWDLAFHMLPMAKVDGEFAKNQLVLFLREWYMHPNGQLPAYEFALGDVNPPVHAMACWRVYKMTGRRGQRDRTFLARVFQKLLINFTWWVNRKDVDGKNIFAGGFLGLDNIGLFDRSKPLPNGGRLEQADGTAWMAGYCGTMLAMALELAGDDPAYEDVASKFFEHFIGISDAINSVGGTGLWDDEDGFYYDQMQVDGTQNVPLRIRSVVGLVPLFAVQVLEKRLVDRLPGFKKRMEWFMNNRPDLARQISFAETRGDAKETGEGHYLLAIPSKEKLLRVLRYLLDESEFLSPHGIRSVSAYHRDHPFGLRVDGKDLSVGYEPGESRTSLFGGNSNWRGPVWFPMSYMCVEALERYHHFFGDDLKVECPTGSGVMMTLNEVAREIDRRMAATFLKPDTGPRPVHANDPRYANDPHWKDLLLFYEYFHGDTGKGLGASHQTGWTALVTRCFDALEC